MKKLLSILLILIFNQFQLGGVLADSDGNLELSKKNNDNNKEIKLFPWLDFEICALI